MAVEPLVTILITTFNRAHLLTRALSSVLRQRWRNKEIVVVNDGSTDDTDEVVKNFREKIVYFRLPVNYGPARAANYGLEVLKGEYFVRFDDDDEWIDEEFLELSVKKFLENHETDLAMVCGGWRLICGNTVVREVIPSAPLDWKERILWGNNLISSPVTLLKTSIVKKLGGYDENLKRGVDSDLFRNIILNGYKVEILPRIVCNVYIDSPHRITDQNSEEKLRQVIENHLYQLKKYERYFMEYPSAEARRYSSIAVSALRLYRLTCDPAAWLMFKRYALKSLKKSPSLWVIVRLFKVLLWKR